MVRMMSVAAVAGLTAAVGVLGGAAAQPDKSAEHAKHAAAPQTASRSSAAFEKLKTLVGEWKGKASHGSAEVFDATVTYRLTGGGSALVETLFPGSEHEMVTVYTRDGDTLLLTHYCSMGNQPRMRCTPGADPSTLKFEFVDGGNMASAADMHMHSLVLKFDGADKLSTTWAMYNQGKPQDEAKFALERVKDGAVPAPADASAKHDHGK